MKMLRVKKMYTLLAMSLVLLDGCGSYFDEGKTDIPTNDIVYDETQTKETDMQNEETYAQEMSCEMQIKEIDGQEYYLIRDEIGLMSIGSDKYPLSGSYILDNDITLTKEWKPIGNTEQPFTGVFDGNGYVIHGLSVTEKSKELGFFGASEGATLKNIVLEDASIDVFAFFPIVCYAVETEITNCSINAEKQLEATN